MKSQEKAEQIIERLEAENKELTSRNSLLKQTLLRTEERVLSLETEIHEYRLHIRNLHEYLQLFLNHPAYRVYKFLKSLFTKTVPILKDETEKTQHRYEDFLRTFEPSAEELRLQMLESQGWMEKPSFSIVTAVYNPPLPIIQDTVRSVLCQTYDHWTWHLVDASTDESVQAYLLSVANQDSRIHPFRLSQNKGISVNTNEALHQATNDYVVMLDHDDTLAPHALFSVAEVIRQHPDADFIYSDADKLNEQGHRCEPVLKPDWSPEMMLCCNLLNQISVFRRSLLDRVGYLNPELDGAQDWDLYLRITEKTDHVYHIPQVLYHWRKTSQSTAQSTANKPYVKKSQIDTLTAHLRRIGLSDPHVQFDYQHPIHGTHPLVTWKIHNKKRVSIIMPSRDHADVLERCLKSFFAQTTYPDYEVILVDTGSQEAATGKLYEKFLSDPRFHVVRCEGQFNFGRACNFGVRSATGDFLLFLNNDTEILQPDWLDLLVQWFEIEGIGVVGAKLLYPGDKIQHGGVIIGLGGLAAHLFKDMKENCHTAFGSDSWYRNLSAVTGACLMISRKAFDLVGGFDEEFQVNYSDVDLCLRVCEARYRIVYTPHVRLVHHEAVTHGRRIPRSDLERANEKWRSLLKSGDPYYNANLSCRCPTAQLKRTEFDSGYRINLSMMARLPNKEMILVPEEVSLGPEED